MRASAYDIRTTHRHKVACHHRGLSNLLGYRELTDRCPQPAKASARFNAVIVMAGHRQTSRPGSCGNTIQGGRNSIATRCDRICHGTKCQQRHAGTATVLRPFDRILQLP